MAGLRYRYSLNHYQQLLKSPAGNLKASRRKQISLIVFYIVKRSANKLKLSRFAILIDRRNIFRFRLHEPAIITPSGKPSLHPGNDVDHHEQPASQKTDDLENLLPAFHIKILPDQEPTGQVIHPNGSFGDRPLTISEVITCPQLFS